MTIGTSTAKDNLVPEACLYSESTVYRLVLVYTENLH